MKIVLIGYMGSGKSTVAKALSETLQCKAIDLDTYIETSEGKTITELFREEGEIYFRKQEGIKLGELLSEPENLIIATGGGTPCYGLTMQTLTQTNDVITVYLKASVDLLTERLFSEINTRPVIAHLRSKEILNDFIRKHLFERAFYYNQAQLIVDTDDRSIDQVVEEIVAQLY